MDICLVWAPRSLYEVQGQKSKVMHSTIFGVDHVLNNKHKDEVKQQTRSRSYPVQAHLKSMVNDEENIFSLFLSKQLEGPEPKVG